MWSAAAAVETRHPRTVSCIDVEVPAGGAAAALRPCRRRHVGSHGIERPALGWCDHAVGRRHVLFDRWFVPALGIAANARVCGQPIVKRCFKLFGLLIAAGVMGAIVVVCLAPISASAGHWPVTSWLLHTAMREAVQTRASGIDTPALRDPALVLRGAGHFARGCAVCHGAPGDPRPVTVLHMTPRPPELPPRISKWKPRIVLDRQARDQVHRHAGVAGTAARRRSVGGGGVSAATVRTHASALLATGLWRTGAGSGPRPSAPDATGRAAARRDRRLRPLPWHRGPGAR